MKKIIKYSLAASFALLMSGCATSNALGVGYEKSACEGSKHGGVCGSPSAIYKNKKLVKKIQENYKASGYPDQLFFSITPSGRILVKEDRNDHFQPYKHSKYEYEINELLNAKFGKTNLSNNLGNPSNNTQSDNLAIAYENKIKLVQTNTNVGTMIRNVGKYTRTWIAPNIDSNGDLVSAHEIYIVLSDPTWIVGEKEPKKTTDVDSATPMSSQIKLIDSNNSDFENAIANQSKEDSKEMSIVNDFLGE